jgi:signal transduction histidine kinase
MKQRSLLGQLLGWQILVTGIACLVLVGGTLVAGRIVIRSGQDSTLSRLADTVCFGVQHELAEPYPDWSVVAAAEHFFRESYLRGYQFELWDRDGELLAEEGDFPGLTAQGLPDPDSFGCATIDATNGDPGVPTLRACRQACDVGHMIRVASTDSLHDPIVQRAVLILLAVFPLAVIIGAVVGRQMLKKLLFPLEALRRSTASYRPGENMRLGVRAEARELAQLEEAFDELLQRLGRMLSREKRFAQEASHELRTPLTNLRLRLEKLKRSAPQETALSPQVDAALANLDSLDDLTESLLMLARSETADLPVIPVDLCDVARESAGIARQVEIGSHPVEIEVGERVLVRANEELLKRAVDNVVENACKYAGENGRIRVSVFSRENRGVVCVEDDGPGIPPDMRRYVFERFFRGPAHRNRVPGIGLGLSVVDAIAERHGGRVQTGPSELGGEKVCIEIPLVRPAPDG